MIWSNKFHFIGIYQRLLFIFIDKFIVCCIKPEFKFLLVCIITAHTITVFVRTIFFRLTSLEATNSIEISSANKKTEIIKLENVLLYLPTD